MQSYLVLVENEITEGHKYDFWDDVTGIRYHYPNQYKNKIKPGDKFIYYRGTRRADGTRGIPEYFGCGIIGDVFLDSSTEKDSSKAKFRWYCDVIDYYSFSDPVEFKINGQYIEKIPQNHWSMAVRNISRATYDYIIELANSSHSETRIKTQTILLVEKNYQKNSARNIIHPQKSYIYQSERAKEIGDRGEKIVFDYLVRDSKYKRVRWVAQNGETPGYDIEIIGENSQIIGVEVKSTNQKHLNSFQLTINEYNAIKTLKERYILAIVTEIDTNTPKLSFQRNISSKIEMGTINLSPLTFKADFY